MNVRKAQRLRNMLLLIGAFMMLGSYFYEPLMVSGIVVASACLIPHFLFNKWDIQEDLKIMVAV